MATISPVKDTGAATCQAFTWETLTESDTAATIEPEGTSGLLGVMQSTGTFGGATVALQGSNDGTNFVALKDVTGTAIGLTAAGAVEFSTAMRYIRPSASGGSSQDLDITIVLRG